MSGSKRTKAKKSQRRTRILGLIGVGLGIGMVVYILNFAGCV